LNPVFNPDIIAPMRVTNVEQKFQSEDPDSPLWLYTLEFDPRQGQRMITRLKEQTPELHDQVMMFDTITISTKTPLMIGVGDLYTPNLVPCDAFPLTPEQEELERRRAELLNTLSGIAGFIFQRPEDE